MAKNNVSVTLDTKRLDAILRNLAGNVEDAVAKAGFAIEGRAKIKAPVDTGALRASIYTAMQRNSGEQAMGKAKALNPDATTVALPTPTDRHTAHVGPSVEYGAAIELGSVRRGATPYLLPALREVERDFAKWIGEAVTDG